MSDGNFDDVILPDQIVGDTATTVGPLNPTGVVLVNGKEYPAKTHGEFIEGDCQVIIVDSGPFGFVVRKKLPTD